MLRIDNHSDANASFSRVRFVVGLGVLICSVLVSSCGEQEKTTKKTREPEKQEQFGGDWYDEYKAEKKAKTISAEDRKLFANPRESMKAARVARAANDNERVIELANQIIKQDSLNAEAHFLRGLAKFYSAFGDENEAVADLEKARELGFKSPDLFISLTKLYDSRKEHRKAIEAVSYGIEVCPNKDLMRCRAMLYATVGNYKEALADLNRYIDLAPGKTMGYFLRGNLYQQMGRTDDALADYLVVVQKSPDSVYARTERAKLLFKVGRNQEGLSEMSKVTDFDKSDDDAFRLRGNIYCKLGQYDRAIADYTQAIKISPEFARASLEARAGAYDKLGKTELAKRDRAEARKLKAKPAEKPIFEMK